MENIDVLDDFYCLIFNDDDNKPNLKNVDTAISRLITIGWRCSLYWLFTEEEEYKNIEPPYDQEIVKMYKPHGLLMAKVLILCKELQPTYVYIYGKDKAPSSWLELFKSILVEALQASKTPHEKSKKNDLIAACGREEFDTIYCNAQDLDRWNTKQLRRLTYTPDLSLNQRYLGELAIPLGKQLIGFKSPKNTGKTHLLQWLTDPIIRAGERRVLVITHRVQLATQLVKKLGLPFITEIKQTEQGSHFGMGLVIDSLHPKSQAKFNPDDWKGCWLILDEIMQLIWHLLSSTTCQSDRVAIIIS
ncbi:hypothetical protein LC612_21990 [Nostoc sp. CHAB 5834]|nr:hypothetical protein [Nostoc sp. CHAB 5834]